MAHASEVTDRFVGGFQGRIMSVYCTKYDMVSNDLKELYALKTPNQLFIFKGGIAARLRPLLNLLDQNPSRSRDAQWSGPSGEALVLACGYRFLFQLRSHTGRQASREVDRGRCKPRETAYASDISTELHWRGNSHNSANGGTSA